VVSGSRARAGRVVWFVVGLLARAVGAGVLFWLVFPLWLSVFWGVQGYPPTLGDLARWYALGAFNAAPIVATVGVSILLTPLLTIRLSSILPPSLRFPPLREGNRAPSVPPAGRGNLKEGVKENRYANKEARRISGIGTPLVSALLYTLLVPPVAYALLLVYAEMWQYRAWDAMTPALIRAYGLVGGAAFGVGWAVGWSMRPSRRRVPAGAIARRN
jgi:hypothetical protein